MKPRTTPWLNFKADSFAIPVLKNAQGEVIAIDEMTDFIPAAKESLHRALLMNRTNEVIQDEINLIATTAVGKKCGMHAIFANLQHANHANY